jgi:electron transport complex protein RnfG
MKQKPDGKPASPDIKAMVKLGLVLAVFATVACVFLAFVYAGTESIIAGHQKEDLELALQEFFPDADDFQDISASIAKSGAAVNGAGTLASPDPAVNFENAYEVKKGGAVEGLAIQLGKGAYGGTLRALVGISADGRIKGVKILEHAETPGLGANAASSTYYVDKPKKITFYGQFTGKSLSDRFEVKDDVIAITAATVTSRAVSDAVKAAGSAASSWLHGGAK